MDDVKCPYYYGGCSLNEDFVCYGNFDGCDIYRDYVNIAHNKDELLSKEKINQAVKACSENKCQECPYYKTSNQEYCATILASLIKKANIKMEGF